MEISTEEGLKIQYKPDQVFSEHQAASGKDSSPQAESQVSIILLVRKRIVAVPRWKILRLVFKRQNGGKRQIALQKR